MTSSRKKVSVTFAGDDDVIEHIVDTEDCAPGARKLRSRSKQSSKIFDSSKAILEELTNKETSDEESAASPLFGPIQDDNVFVQGTDLFTFKSSKRSHQMIQKAVEARTPKSKTKAQRTPSKHQNTENESIKCLKKTPIKNSTLSVRRIETTTPFRLRKRNHLEGGDSSEDSLDSSSEEEQPDNENSNTVPNRPNNESSNTVSNRPGVENTNTIRTRVKPTDEAHTTDIVGDYFEMQSLGTGPTSDRTLAKLSSMSESSLNQILTNILTSHQRECTQIINSHQVLFNDWMYQLCNGFNLLLYGLGSKSSLLELFRQTMLSNFTHLVVNGYFPSLTVKQILNSITEDILQVNLNFRNPLDQLDFIKTHYLNEEYEDVYLVINNIDGSMLRGEKVQTILSLLSQVRGFHVIASLDHINSPLIWDKVKCSRFNWLWYDVTTYIPYSEETSYENSLLVQQTGALALSSLTHVLRSLTLNARRIFLLLAHFQMDNKPGNPNYTGISFKDMYQRCRENFLVNSDLTLRTQLTEFRDHKLITSKKGHDGMEYLLIPVEMSTLTEFLETQEDPLTQD